MPERRWKGLLVTTEEYDSTRDEPGGGRIVKVEVEDSGAFVEAFCDALVGKLDGVARTVVFECERDFWEESEVVGDDE
jgi:hypothetical protein